MDVEGLRPVLQGLKDGRIRKVAVDLPEPERLRAPDAELGALHLPR